jgi:nicotinamide-nucleotide amidase
MIVETLATGDELRLGEIVDTNSAYIAQALADHGLTVSRMTVVGDARHDIAAAIAEAAARADVVLVTGGLGPTDDDLGREALADVLGVGLEIRPEAVQAIADRIGRPPNAKNVRQARAPVGVDLIANTCGTAPGMCARCGACTVYAMPGVPYEMEQMLALSVLPAMLEAREDAAGASARRYFVVHGVPESEVAIALDAIHDPAIVAGTRVSHGSVLIRLWAHAGGPDEVQRALEVAGGIVIERFGSAICGEGDHDLAYFAGHALIDRGLTVAVAESCTGGTVAARLASVSGISAALREAVVAYSDDAKVRRLGVDARLLREHGAVSAEVARAMAEGIRVASGADVGVATTGIAGPAGGSAEKPVGLVYVASASAEGNDVSEKRFRGNRAAIVERSAETALWMLLNEARRR